MRGRARKGLSPLVASVVLISAAILGGVFVYNYFQKSVNTVVGGSGTVQLTADYDYLNATHVIVHIEILNSHQSPVKITDIKGVDATGSIVAIKQGLNVNLEPGGKYSTVAIVPSGVKAVFVTYELDGKPMDSSTVNLG